MSENTSLTYYQKKTRDVILNRAKDDYESDKKKDKGWKREINTETYLKKEKNKKKRIQ